MRVVQYIYTCMQTYIFISYYFTSVNMIYCKYDLGFPVFQVLKHLWHLYVCTCWTLK